MRKTLYVSLSPSLYLPRNASAQTFCDLSIIVSIWFHDFGAKQGKM